MQKGTLSKTFPTCALLTFILTSSGPAKAEDYLGIYGGFQFSVKGTELSAQEDLNYTGAIPNRHAATGSDLDLKSSATLGLRAGYFFDSIPNLGIETEGQYSRPDFKRQDVTITLINTSIGGFSSFTEDQLEADFHMLMGGINLIYRFNQFGTFKPYIGGGPAVFGLFIRGSGDSCRIIAPAALTRGFCEGGKMDSNGVGYGFNAKAGVEIPFTENWSLDAEYKYSFAKFDVDWFRSFSDIEIDYQAHNLTAGLRYKF